MTVRRRRKVVYDGIEDEPTIGETAVSRKLQLSAKEVAIVNGELAKRKKSTVIGYLLWFFLGFLGAHCFYVGNKFGIVYPIQWILWIVSIFARNQVITVAAAIFGVFTFFFWLFDGFGMPKIIRETNDRIEAEIVDEILYEPD